MSTESEITFMQVRIIRLACEKWNIPLGRVVDLFDKAGVLDYIEKGYGIFHCEGDEAVLEDVEELFEAKGIKVDV